jgi:hypothetical protein
VILDDVANLTSVDEGGGSRRHFLAGRAIHCGDSLELKLADGTWMPVRYELDWYKNGESRPVLYFTVKVAGRTGERWYPDACIEIPAHATLRLPARGKRWPR